MTPGVDVIDLVKWIILKLTPARRGSRSHAVVMIASLLCLPQLKVLPSFLSFPKQASLVRPLDEAGAELDLDVLQLGLTKKLVSFVVVPSRVQPALAEVLPAVCVLGVDQNVDLEIVFLVR